jgi:hypothetical protein
LPGIASTRPAGVRVVALDEEHHSHQTAARTRRRRRRLRRRPHTPGLGAHPRP